MFPQAKIGIVLLKKFQSQKRSPKPIIELFKESNELAKTYLVEDNFSDNIENSRNSPTLAGELYYRDDKGAVCRYLNWRDGERIMITIKLKMRLLLLNYWIVRE